MNYQEFQNKFGTEEQCLEYLYHLRWPNGFCCPRCRNNEAWHIKEFKYKCRKCGYQTTVTAGTIFHHTHIPMSLWFKAAWFISENDNRVSTSQLKKELGLGNRRTPSAILKTFRQTFQQTLMRPQLQINPPTNLILHGSIDVVQRFINAVGYRGYINIAVDTRIGNARASLAGSPEKLTGFIENCVAKGSTISSDILGLNNRNPLFKKGYICKERAVTYKYNCADRVFNYLLCHLPEHLKGTCTKAQIPICLEECCAEFNMNKIKKSKTQEMENNSTFKITFQQLLQNAVCPCSTSKK